MARTLTSTTPTGDGCSAPGHSPGQFSARPASDLPIRPLLPRGISSWAAIGSGQHRVLDSSTRTAPTWRNDHPVDPVNQALLEDVVGTQTAELPTTFRLGAGQVHTSPWTSGGSSQVS